MSLPDSLEESLTSPRTEVKIDFDDFWQNPCAKSMLGLTINEATQFSGKESFEKQFEKKERSPGDEIWDFSPDAIDSRNLFWIEDADNKIEATGQRFIENTCLKSIGLESGWRSYSIDKKGSEQRKVVYNS